MSELDQDRFATSWSQLNSSFVSVGQTDVNVEGYGGDLSAAYAANGPGKRYRVRRNVTVTNDLALGDSTVVESAGPSICTVTLNGTARIISAGFDGLTGTNPTAGPWGPSGLGLHGLKVTGGGGIKLYGPSPDISDLEVSGASGPGLYTEWTNANASIPTHSMEGSIRRVKSHDNGSHGIHINGPHDSMMSDLISYNNATGSTGVRLDTKANGVQISRLHAWGIPHAKAVQMLASGIQINNSQAEGASQAQVEVSSGSCAFDGYIYAAGANHAVKGVLTSPGCGGFRLSATIENCESGAIDFTNDVGGSEYRAIIRQSTGSAYVGTIPTTSSAILVPMGGVQIHGYTNAAIMGSVNFNDGTVIFQGSNPIFANGGAPALATSQGTPGMIGWDASYFYVCVAPNSWKRTALAAW